MVEILVKKTIDLSNEEKNGLIELFNDIFEKSRTVFEFDNQYLYNSLGYSYHVFMIENDKIVGSLSSIPSHYCYKGEKMVFVINVDAMIKKEYRDFFYYHDMYMAIDDFAKNDGAVLSYSFPNDKSNPLVIKAKIQYTIGQLYTYMLPYRISAVKSNLKSLDFASVSLSWLWIHLISLISRKEVHSFQIKKDDETFNESRYHRMDANYTIVNKSNSWFAFKIMSFEGKRAAFLIDVKAKSPHNFNKAIRYIVKNHSSDFDILLYVGYLPFGGTGLIKVPRKFEPKHFHFAAKIFNKSVVNKEDVFNICNWDVNLSNTDLI